MEHIQSVAPLNMCSPWRAVWCCPGCELVVGPSFLLVFVAFGSYNLLSQVSSSTYRLRWRVDLPQFWTARRLGSFAPSERSRVETVFAYPSGQHMQHS